MKQLHKYEYSVSVYAESAAAKVVRLVGADKSVLEIGAGPGSITRLLKEAGCRVAAVERDEEAIRVLTAHCERVHRLDLNDAGWTGKACADGRFDVVVAADVLEHLLDPWATLRDMRQTLAPGGYAVVSLPHVGHNAVIGALASGSFEYRDSGLLDRTHLRFFCVDDIQVLFHQAGWKIVAAEFVVRRPEHTELAERWRRLPAALRAGLAHNRHGDVYQVVVQAVPAEAPGTALELSALPVPGERAWAAAAPLHFKVLMGVRPLARILVPKPVRETVERMLRARGWLK